MMQKRFHKLPILLAANIFFTLCFGATARAVEQITIDFEELGVLGTQAFEPLITRTFRGSTPSVVYVQGPYNSGYPNNGGYYSRIIFSESPWTLEHRDGLTFRVISIDVSEYSVVYKVRSSVTFTGYTSDGNQETKTILTDGQIDGMGALTDFETFPIGGDFENLTRLEITGGSMIDNIVVELAGRPLTPPDVVANPAIEDGIRLLWQNPMGYLHWIYRRDKNTGNFEKLGETRSSSFNDTNLGDVDSAEYRIQINDELNNVISGFSPIVRAEPGRTVPDIALGPWYGDLVGLGIMSRSGTDQKIREAISGSTPQLVRVVTGNSGTGFSPVIYRANRGHRFLRTSHFTLSPARKNVTARVVSSGYLTRPLLGGKYERISVESEVRNRSFKLRSGFGIDPIILTVESSSPANEASDKGVISTYYLNGISDGSVRPPRSPQ